MIVHVLSRKWPFPSEAVYVDPDNPDVLTAVSEFDRRNEYIKMIREDNPLISLIKRCLSNSPNHRPTSKDVCDQVRAMANEHLLSYANRIELLRMIRSLERDKELLNNENQKLQEEKDDLIGERETLMTQNKSLVDDNEDLSNQLQTASLSTSFSHLAELEILQSSVSDYRSEIAHLQGLLEQKEIELRKAERQHRDIVSGLEREEKSILEQEYRSHIHSTLCRHISEKAVLEEEIKQESRKRHETHFSALEDQHKQEMSRLQGLLELKEMELSEVEKQRRDVVSEHKQQIQEVKSVLMQELESKMRELASKDGILTSKANTIESHREQLNKVVATGQSLERPMEITVVSQDALSGCESEQHLLKLKEQESKCKFREDMRIHTWQIRAEEDETFILHDETVKTLSTDETNRKETVLCTSNSMSGNLTIQDVANFAGVEIKHLNQVCSETGLLQCAELCDPWELIGQHLKLKPYQISAIDRDCNNTDVKRVKVLQRWHEIFHHQATYKVLIEAFLMCQKNQQAIKVCQIMAQIEGHNQTAKDATHVPSSSSEQSHFNQVQPVSTALCKATQPTISGLQEDVSTKGAKKGSMPNQPFTGQLHEQEAGANSLISMSDPCPTLPQAFKLLYQHADQWQNIGLFLDIDDKELTSISNKNETSSLREMLRLWLRSPLSSWKTLADAMEKIDDEIAAVIRQKHHCR